MPRPLKSVRRTVGLLFPGAWIVFAVWALQKDDAINTAATPYAVYFCYGALAAAALISWYYDTMRLLAISLAVGSIIWFLREQALNTPALLTLGNILLAFDFAALIAIRERGVVSIKGMVAIALVVGQFAALMWFVARHPALLDWPAWAEKGALGMALVALLVFVLIRRTKVEHGFFWSFCAVALGALAGSATDAMLLYGGAAGLILMFAVLEHGHDIAYLDELTGLPGRRAFNQQLARLGKTYCIAMCDVDHFKRFNDTYGHDAGDQALKMVAARLAEVEGGGKVFRFGGEEFVLVFRNHDAQETQSHLEALRKAIADEPFIVRSADRSVVNALTKKAVASDTQVTTITVSIGLAERGERRTSPELVLEAADAALYRAKALGRNRLVCANGVESVKAAEKS